MSVELAVRTILDKVDKRIDAVRSYRAIVTGVTGGLVSIRRPEAASAGTAGYAIVEGFTPQVGDEVLCVNVGKFPVVIGVIQRAAPSGLVLDLGGNSLALWNGSGLQFYSDAGGNRTFTLQGSTGIFYWGTISTGNPSVRVGTGTPEGAVTSSPPSLYLRIDTGQLYIKESGTSTNTGWILIASTSGATFAGDLIIGRHERASSSAPSIVKLTAAGTTATASITEGNDVSGVLQLVPGGTGIAAGSVATITWATAYPGSSYGIQLTPYSSAARALTPGNMGPTNRSSTAWDLVSPIALTSGSTYQWAYRATYHG